MTDQLAAEGYAIVEDVLVPSLDLDPIVEQYQTVLDRLVGELLAAGGIADPQQGLPFGPRLIAITRAAQRSLAQHFDISLPQSDALGDAPLNLSSAAFALITHPRLLDTVQSVIGPEILFSPVGHVRMKLPEDTLGPGADSLMAKVPWHQDNGVVLPEADESTVLTVWIPLTDTTLDNGCMQVLPTPVGSPLRPHALSSSAGAHVPIGCVDESQSVTLPIRAGSVLLMHSRTMHASLGNTTVDQVRISMDLRYQAPDQPTGRPQFPSFLARSPSHPDQEIHDPREWVSLWEAARLRLKGRDLPPFNRWGADTGSCA
ncbi:MAG: phytanoyl-CoA dioxygenase family protein [Acidimicrobiales bacterium]